MKNLSIYIHWPWCKSKCPYCDFNSHTFKKYDEDLYVECILKELDYTFNNLSNDGKNQIVSSIYFGGGTPSLMEPESVGKIINKVKSLFTFSDAIEISSECNPTSAEASKMQEFVKMGVNRISIGVQSINDDHLKFLGREHSSAEAFVAVDYAYKATKNVNFDLIYGLPDQSLESWKKDLEYAVSVNTPHISCYQLTIEKNTAFYNMYKANKLTMPSVDIQADFFEYTRKYLIEQGYINYEVSNFAKPGFDCKHNVNIWQYNNYLGIGAGAHGRYINKHGDYIATQNIKAPTQYVKAIQEKENAYSKLDLLSQDNIAVEATLLGLRLHDGLNIADLEKTYNINWFEFVNKAKYDLFVKEQMLENSNGYVKLTEKSKHLLNEILVELLT